MELGLGLVSSQIWGRLGISKSSKFKAWAGERSKEPQPAMKWRGKEGESELLTVNSPTVCRECGDRKEIGGGFVVKKGEC